MNVVAKLTIVAVLIVGIYFVIGVPETSEHGPAAWAPGAISTGAPLPRLVDLGSLGCIPCKRMEPILDQLRSEYSSRLRVDFIDVGKYPAAAKYYSIRLIPTQIFFDSGGRELVRHEGFMSKEDILAQWAALGVSFDAQRGGRE